MTHLTKVSVSLLAVIACLLVAGTAAAAQPPAPTTNSPVGLWKLSTYDDTQAGMPLVGVQEVCFQAGGTWFSPVFAGWGGIWFQKGNNGGGNGDHLRVLGNWNSGEGNDAAELDFVHTPLMTGTWTEWTDSAYPPPPPSSFWFRVKLCYIGSSCGNALTGNQATPAPATVSNSTASAATCTQ